MNIFGSDNYYLETLDIKSEIDIKDEPIEYEAKCLSKENDLNNKILGIKSDIDIKDEPVEYETEYLSKESDLTFDAVEFPDQGQCDKNMDDGEESVADQEREDGTVAHSIPQKLKNLKLSSKIGKSGTPDTNVSLRSDVNFKRTFECHICHYKSYRRDHLKIHLLTHSNTKLLKCFECDYECNQKSSLKRHILTHSTTKLFKCCECGYECNRKENLKRHLLTHASTKLFKCYECDYECNQKRNLRLHLLTHSNTKLFKCSECDYECNRKDHLRSHLLIHSKK